MRERIWQRIATDLDIEQLSTLYKTISLQEVPRAAEQVLAGKHDGRYVIAIN